MQFDNNTPLCTATFKLFDKLKESILSQYPTLTAGYVKAYIFGGTAMHFYTHERYSHDVDTGFNVSQLNIDTDIVVYYENGKSRTSLVLDTNFNVELGLIHPDYRENAIPLQEKPDSPLWLYLASPVDLAVSKIARFADVDKQDISLLAERKLITLREFTMCVDEALLYYAVNNVWLKYNIEDAKKLIFKASE